VKKRICCILAVIFSLMISNITYAGPVAYHNKQLEEVLFGEGFDTNKLNKGQKKRLDDLKKASRLAIDQMNGELQADMDSLCEDVKGIPQKNVSKHDYNIVAAGQRHRSPSHRGWEVSFYTSKSDQKRWKNRRSVLLATVNYVFGFKKKISIGGGDGKLLGYSSQCEDLSAIIYYTHILGDRIDDSQYYVEDVIMGIGGRKDERDIISQLKKHIEHLFRRQKKSADYIYVMEELDSININLAELDPSNTLYGAPLTDSKKFSKYKEYGTQVMNLLIDRLPKMLQKEKFFTKTFGTV